MKRNKLSTAIAAGVAGVAGIASVSNAVNINPDGLGQVLIYPYYTVNNDLNTLISIVNTTSDVKAVKVRFLEGDNTQEVLDFNLYLSPFDVWTAALQSTVASDPALAFATTPVIGQDSARLVTSDTSCVPNLNPPREFLPFAFQTDAGSDAMERVRDGHFEAIEMGVVVPGPNGFAAAATHINGVPADCSLLENAWGQGGIWTNNPDTEIGAATGGLFGSATLVNVAEGTDAAYNAEAINGYHAPGGFLHSSPGDLSPSLADSDETSIVFFNADVITSEWDEGEDAISALFMHDAVYNEYALATSINAKTEWVLTFPTKRFYVNQDPAVRPFTEPFDSPAGSCEDFAIVLYDREENSIAPAPGSVSPLPPQRQNPAFCWETNVLDFYNSSIGGSATNPSSVLGSTNVVSVNTNPLVNGWSGVTFPIAVPMTDSDDDWTYGGYPVTGFAVQTFSNANAQPGLLAQYAGLFKHRFSKDIVSATP